MYSRDLQSKGFNLFKNKTQLPLKLITPDS